MNQNSTFNKNGVKQTFFVLVFLFCTCIVYAQQVVLPLSYGSAGVGADGKGVFKVPSCGVSQIKIEIWGAGGGGGYRQLAGNSGGYGSAGGGGGAYEILTLSVMPGEIIQYEIGKGGSGGSDGTANGGAWTNIKNGKNTVLKREDGTIVISVAGGKGALDNTVQNNTSSGSNVYGQGGIKTTTNGYNGGKGGTAASNGGGGGGAGSPGKNGGNGGNGTGGASSVNNLLGGSGGAGGANVAIPAPVGTGKTGNGFGGGGGGSLKFSTSTTAISSPLGGAGANGGIVITYTVVNKIYMGSNTGKWGFPTNWSLGVLPTSSDCVNIPANKSVTVDVPLAYANTIVIENTGRITIPDGSALKVENTILNNGKIVVQSNGNLLQTTESVTAYSAGINGEFTVERYVEDMDNSKSQMDYVYWSSPVSGQNIQSFSPGTPGRNLLQYNEATDFFVSTKDSNFLPAKGYAIRAEVGAGYPANDNGYDKTYKFMGTPNNGNYSVEIAKQGNGFNLVGNPYPSNIDFDQLFANNSSLINNIIYFWTNENYTPTQMGSGYDQSNYLVYNGVGGQDVLINGIITVGQSVMIEKTNAGSGNLNFKNSYGSNKDLRVAAQGTFYQKNTSEKDRFWLTLTSPNEIDNTQLIGYIDGATNELDKDFDAEALSLSSNLFYSQLGDKKLVIQGKSKDFKTTDKVKLGANFFAQGEYTITLKQPEGIFGEQSIYLKDNDTGIITNLKDSSYVFLTDAGQKNNRFEIIYENESVLITDSIIKESLIVYRDSDNFVVKSPKMITVIEVFDMSGKLIRLLKPNRKESAVQASSLTSGIYLLLIRTDDGAVTAKKISK